MESKGVVNPIVFTIQKFGPTALNQLLGVEKDLKWVSNVVNIIENFKIF